MSEGATAGAGGEPVPVRDAATVMLVRDGEAGLEVFMLRRHLDSVFVPGAHVFPGGAVDEADGHVELEGLCAGRTDAEASTVLGLDPATGGLAFWVAAVREAFEEAGILLAYGPDGGMVDLRPPEVEFRFARHRREVHAGGRSLVEICVEEDLRLAVDAIHYFSHWITPVGAPRRFDTRFFVALAPEGQVALHDEAETISHVWTTPAEVLARSRAGEVELILPTIRSLRAISRFERAADLLAAAAYVEEVPAAVAPVVRDLTGSRIVLPGDPARAVLEARRA